MQTLDAVSRTSDMRIAVRLWIRGLRSPSSFHVRNGKTTRPVSSHAVDMWSSSDEGESVVLSMLTRCCSQAKIQNAAEDVVLNPTCTPFQDISDRRGESTLAASAVSEH
jgi:hypothetical protein